MNFILFAVWLLSFIAIVVIARNTAVTNQLLMEALKELRAARTGAEPKP